MACGGPEPARPVTPAGGFAVGEGPYDVVLADLDGDEILDAASANLTGESITVLLGGEPGRPAWRQDFRAGGIAVAVTAGDLDGSGEADLAAAVRSAPGHVALIMNHGGGRLVPGPWVKLPGTPNDIAAGDLNEDGRPDLVVALREEAVALVLSPASRKDVSVQRIPLTGCGGSRDYGPDGVTLADLDRDGRRELVVACYGAWSVQVLGNPAGDAAGRSWSEVARLPPETIVAAVGELAPDRAGDSDPLPGGLRKVKAADLDGDGWIDLAAVADWGLLLLAFGDGESFPEVRVLSTGVDGTNTLAVGDLNGDGRQEIVLTSGHEQAVAVLTAGNWRQDEPHVHRTGELPDTPESVVLADLDHDDRLDAVIAAERAHAVQFLQGTGHGELRPFGAEGPGQEGAIPLGDPE
jgi:hypothetical protein